MQRREFVTLASTWSLAAHAQSDRVRRIGVLMAHTEGDREFQAYLAAFREGLKRLGCGLKAAICRSTLAGAHLRTRKSGNDPPSNSSLSDQTSSLLKTRRRPLQCCKK